MLLFILFLVFLHIYVFCFYHLCHDTVGKNIFVHTLGYLHNHTCMLSHVIYNYVCT